MATARITLGSLFESINATANVATSTLNTISAGVGMGQRYVADAATKQKIRSKLDLSDFTVKLSEEKAMEATQRKLEIVKFTDQSELHKSLYIAEQQRIELLLKDL